MNLITRFELVSKNKTELQGIYRKVFIELIKSEPNSPERSNALASLENIQRELALR